MSSLFQNQFLKEKYKRHNKQNARMHYKINTLNKNHEEKIVLLYKEIVGNKAHNHNELAK